MEHYSWWRSFKTIIGFGAKKYGVEICGGGIIGVLIGGDWVFARIDPSLAAHILALIIFVKGIICASVSAVASAYATHLFKKHILKIDQNEPPTRKRQRKGRKAA